MALIKIDDLKFGALEIVSKIKRDFEIATHLDSWGAVWGVARAGESDDKYRQRLLETMQRPRMVNVNLTFKFDGDRLSRREAIMAQKARNR